MDTVKKRRTSIEQLINERGNITFVELKEVYPHVSDMTLRTDLKSLDQERRIVRIHGGAKSVKDVVGIEDSLQMRTARHMVAKKSIARKACSLISEGQTIFLGSGSTTTVLAGMLQDYNNLIVTTGVSCAMKLSTRENSKVLMPGGMLDFHSMGLSGINTVSQLGRMNFDLAIMSAAGFHPDIGFSCLNEDEAVLNQTVMKRAKQTIILMDSSKYDKVTTFSFSLLNDIDGLISEAYPPLIQELCQQSNVMLY